jgi:hypothetical protein
MPSRITLHLPMQQNHTRTKPQPVSYHREPTAMDEVKPSAIAKAKGFFMFFAEAATLLSCASRDPKAMGCFLGDESYRGNTNPYA